MMEIRFTSIASSHLKSITGWYLQKDRDTANRFIKSFETRLNQISAFPEMCRKRVDMVRIATIPNFPQLVAYEITNETITIMAVVHTSRHPDEWQERASNNHN